MKHFAVLLAGFALSAATLHAQASSNSVPESHRPPPGMCRIWIDGVPATHQPAPTDCATAIRKRPMNARVVFGSDTRGDQRGFAPASPKQSSFSSPTVPSPEEQDRAAQQKRDEQERQRAEAQRQREEQDKRAASHAPPPQPQTPRSQERVAAPPRPHPEKSQRPPQPLSSSRRPR